MLKGEGLRDKTKSRVPTMTQRTDEMSRLELQQVRGEQEEALGDAAGVEQCC